jgi:hypothetical protein
MEKGNFKNSNEKTNKQANKQNFSVEFKRTRYDI